MIIRDMRPQTPFYTGLVPRLDGMGQISEGRVKSLFKRVQKLRGDVAKAEDALAKAQYKLDTAKQKKWIRHWTKIRDARRRNVDANKRQHASALRIWQEAKADLERARAQAAAEAARAEAERAPAPEEEAAPEETEEEAPAEEEPEAEGMGGFLDRLLRW